jgi:hypothetical protein
MCNSFLRKDHEMSSAAFISHAADLSRQMVARESRGPGDIDNAMRRLEARYGIPYSILWALRFRKPKTLDVGVFARILGAYESECDRQQRAIEHEREITRAKTAIGRLIVAASDALGREEV